MVLSNHSMVFVYVSSPRSYFASRPYNYSLCGVLGRRTWKAYLKCLYCKVKAWIHGGKQHTNMIKSASVWIWVEGWLLKGALSKSNDWDHGLSLMLNLSFFARHFFHSSFLALFFQLYLCLFFITYSPCLFFRLVWRMKRDLKYMESLFCGKMKRHVCGEVEGMSMLALSVRA